MRKEHEAWLALVQEEPIEPTLPICDAHHHLWDRPDDRYLPDDFLNDAGSHNIVKTVFVECRANYRQGGPREMRPVGETESVREIAEEFSRRQRGNRAVANGIVGYADLTLGGGVAPVLEAHAAAGKGRFRGIRNITTWHEKPESVLAFHNAPKGLLLDPIFRAGFAFLKKYDLSYDSAAYFTQLMEVVDLARAFPDTAIIVNHTGGVIGVGPYAGKKDDVFHDWKLAIAALASCANVCVKLGGLGMERCGFGWHERDNPPASADLAVAMTPYYEWCVEQFGVDRCMFESNFPVDKVSYSYAVLWNAFKLMTKGLSPQERDALFHDTAAKVYRL